MTKIIKIYGIKKAIHDYRDNPHLPHKHFMMDLRDGEIWCDCFLDSNSWRKYHSPEIVNIDGAICYFADCDPRNINMSVLKKAGEHVLETVANQDGHGYWF